ncbi:MAG: hypothetical protein A2Y73_01050 [Chloroflexi bacterium RBG_13_56_8]|nr:MAG: hypothetical protein A2Y73_01050 [Chloroflexi bacterium RBG_13_56_8]
MTEFEEFLADEPLDAHIETFWRMGEEAQNVHLRVRPPEVEMEALKLLGEPDFAPNQDFADRLAQVYRTVSQKALEVAFGEGE